MGDDLPTKDQEFKRKQRLDAQIAAFDSLQDWSKWMVGVDAGVLGLLAFAFEKSQGLNQQAKGLLTMAVISFCASLLIATWLVGAAPAFLQRLKADDEAELEPLWLKWKKMNIYAFKYGGISIQAYSFLQHLTFMLGAVLLTGALLVGLWCPASTKPRLNRCLVPSLTSKSGDRQKGKPDHQGDGNIRLELPAPSEAAGGR